MGIGCVAVVLFYWLIAFLENLFFIAIHPPVHPYAKNWSFFRLMIEILNFVISLKIYSYKIDSF